MRGAGGGALFAWFWALIAGCRALNAECEI